MYKKIKFLYVYKKNDKKGVDFYHFGIDVSEEKTIFFYTFKDLSGFNSVYSLDYKDFIVLGLAISENIEYIKKQIELGKMREIERRRREIERRRREIERRRREIERRRKKDI